MGLKKSKNKETLTLKNSIRLKVVIHKEKSNKMQKCIKIFIIPYLYEAQHVLLEIC
jgi:hypothetical protein